MSKYTPGPWNLYIDDGVYITSSKDGFHNKDIASWYGDDWAVPYEPGREELEANARLISKSPEMIEMLKDISELDLDNPLQADLDILISKVNGDMDRGKQN